MSISMEADQVSGLRRLSADQKRFFDENGYLILEGFFAASRIATLKARIDELWADRGPDNPLVIDCFEDYLAGTPMQRTFFREVDAAVRRFPYKLTDLHLVDDMFANIAA